MSNNRKHTDSERERQYAVLLKQALARPGVREVMEVYGHWRESDQGLDAYRTALRNAQQVTNSNSSNIG